MKRIIKREKLCKIFCFWHVISKMTNLLSLKVKGVSVVVGNAVVVVVDSAVVVVAFGRQPSVLLRLSGSWAHRY